MKLIGEGAKQIAGTNKWTVDGRTVEMFQEGGKWFARTAARLFEVIFD